jgi:hypothetical protein
VVRTGVLRRGNDSGFHSIRHHELNLIESDVGQTYRDAMIRTDEQRLVGELTNCTLAPIGARFTGTFFDGTAFLAGNA